MSSLSSRSWFPGPWDVRDMVVFSGGKGARRVERYARGAGLPSTMRVQEHRSWRRRLFLLLTEPDTSVLSALFFWILVAAIMIMNIVMMLQTMAAFQFTPSDCLFCGGDTAYLFEDNAIMDQKDETSEGVPCICAPTPFLWTDRLLRYMVFAFSIEWILRVVCFSPAPHERANSVGGKLLQWVNYVFSWPQILDFWATFPYYMEFTNINTNGLMSLRLLRLFRVFQLVRLGSYNVTFTSLMKVLQAAMEHLKILLMMLTFGAALFGSVIFWLEKGEWKYWQQTQQHEFIRINEHGEEEVSPFTSIPATFYWFMVTATTVGYGDVYPTSNAGRSVGVIVMLLSMLVVAFPVGIFSDLWSKELERVGAVKNLDELTTAVSMDSEEDIHQYNNEQDLGGGGGGMGVVGGKLSSGEKGVTNGAFPGPSMRGNASPGGKLRNIEYQHHVDEATQSSFEKQNDVCEILEQHTHVTDAGQPLFNSHHVVGQSDTEQGSATTNELSTSNAPAALNPYSAHRINPWTGSAIHNWNYGYQHAPNIQNEHVDPNNIAILQKSDLIELLRHVESITSSQEQIRHILRKYNVSK